MQKRAGTARAFARLVSNRTGGTTTYVAAARHAKHEALPALPATPAKRKREREHARAEKRAREAREASPRAAAAKSKGDGGGAARAASPAPPPPAPAPTAELHVSPPAAAASQQFACHKLLYVDDAAGVTVATCEERFIRSEFIAAGFTFKAEPTPRWTLARAADDALLTRLCAAAAKRDCKLQVKRGPAPRAVPAPYCPVHGMYCVLRTAGVRGGDAEQEHFGLRFWTCPKSSKRSGCPWLWEDGTNPLQLYLDNLAANGDAGDEPDDDADDDEDAWQYGCDCGAPDVDEYCGPDGEF